MSMIPNFINRKEPTMPDLPTTTPHSDPVEAANALGNHVAALIAERDKLREELRLARMHNETLIATLDRAERDRDHYQGKAQYFERFSMGVVTNFNTIRMIVDDTQRKANEFATPKQPQEAPPEAHTSPEAPTTRDHGPIEAVERALAEAQYGETRT
jgi:hypothetical protein